MKIEPEQIIAFGKLVNKKLLSHYNMLQFNQILLSIFSVVVLTSNLNAQNKENVRTREIILRAFAKGEQYMDISTYPSTVLLHGMSEFSILNGAPSTYIPNFALSEYYWTEYTQAKYDMRRLLGDLGHDIETSVFTIINNYYNWGDRAVLNTKGLIQSDITMAAIRPKVAYYAVQNIASIFDNNMELISGFNYSTTNQESMSVYGYQNKATQTPMVVLWFDGKNVTNSFETKPCLLSLKI